MAMAGFAVACLITCQGQNATELSYDFVFHNLVVDPADGSPAAGFNFDGRFSNSSDALGCLRQDRVSDLDLDQNQAGCSGPACQGGVDNMLPKLTNEFECMMLEPFRIRLAEEAAIGHFVWILRLYGADNLYDDPTVRVTIHRGFSDDVDCAAQFTGQGQFRLAQVTGGPTLPALEGSIVNGRLRISGENIDTTALFGFPIEKLELRVSLPAAGNIGTQGNLGMQLPQRGVAATLAKAIPQYFQSIRATVAGLGDIAATDDTCPVYLDHGVAGHLGVGLRFELAHANITGSAWSQPSGRCGTQPPLPAGPKNQAAWDQLCPMSGPNP